MSKTETNLLAVDKILGVIFLAVFVGVGGTWLYQHRPNPVALVVEQAQKNGQETQDVFSSSAKFPTTGLPLSFPQGNPLEGHFKAQEESMRRVRESIKSMGIKTSDD